MIPRASREVNPIRDVSFDDEELLKKQLEPASSKKIDADQCKLACSTQKLAASDPAFRPSKASAGFRSEHLKSIGSRNWEIFSHVAKIAGIHS